MNRGPFSSSGAIYCRIPHLRAPDQTPVDRQELRCRALADRLGITVDPRLVYLDTRAMSWQRDRTRSGWEAMLATARAGGFGHLICYAPEQLLWQPFDLVELLRAVEAVGLALHGCLAGRDLGDPEQRLLLLAEAEHACRAAEEVSEAARAAHEAAAAQGRPHGGGRRAYGYQAGSYRLIETEAAVVREIYTRYLAGESIRSIALDLHARGVPTSGGNRWTMTGVARVLDAPRYAGLRVFRGAVQRAGDGGYVTGTWEPCVSVAEWEQVRDLREIHGQAGTVDRRPPRPYPLTGLLLCTRCDRHMVGHMLGAYPFYSCTSKSGLAAGRCLRHIAAERLEGYMAEAAIATLEQRGDMDVLAPLATAVGPRSAGLDADLDQLAELANLRRGGRLTATEYATLRSTALHRVREAHRAVAARPADSLDGVVTGPGARAYWNRLPLHRKATVLRALFSSVRIGPSSTARNTFDYGRIELIANPSRPF